MKKLKIDDLKYGVIYRSDNGTICKWGVDDSICSIDPVDKDYINEPGGYTSGSFYEANEIEKCWLKKCIESKKFIAVQSITYYK
jgi:hypothetical protein